uniref:Uncharacterized protein n=1 Tax=Ciona savignyi TaxID=51511 RepID=H2YUM1_CIOSA
MCRESLTTRLPALTPQLPDDNHRFLADDFSFVYPVFTENTHLRHLNKHRAALPPSRRRPAKYSSDAFEKKLPVVSEEGKSPSHRVSAIGKFKKLALNVKQHEDRDSFTRSSLIRNPIHRPRKRSGAHTSSDSLTKKATQLSKVTSV